MLKKAFFLAYLTKKQYLCPWNMNKRLLHIIEWVVAIAAYAWLTYKLVTYDHYDIVASGLRAMSAPQWWALAASIALMPVNMLIEAWRWRTLMPMSLYEAQRQVYYSKLAGLITPWRLGEYPARAVLMKNSPITNDQSPITNDHLWSRVLSAGAVGSATMTAAIILAGTVALVFSPTILQQLGNSYLYALLIIVLVLGLALWLAPQWIRKWFFSQDEFANPQKSHLVWRSLAQSLIRLACWCLQLALVLYALNANDQLPMTNDQWIGLTPIYYLLVTVTPNVPIVEAGVRGAWAMFLFGTPNAALAGVLLWAINTLLPCLSWPFFRKKERA